MPTWAITDARELIPRACNNARAEGKEQPPYTQEKILELRRQDLEIVSGTGVEVSLRDSIGWQSPEVQQSLDEWEQAARRKLELAMDLSPERWCEVWGVDDEEEE
jgi:hypothetical protein